MTTQEARVPDFSHFLRGLPWVIAILVFSLLSYLVFPPFFKLFMAPLEAEYAALAMGPQVALTLTLFALANNWPFHKVENRWARGICLTILAIIVQAVFWLILSLCFHVSLEAWAFPIIATSWFFIALTSFVGGDAHMPDTPPVKRMFINLLIMVAGTTLVMNTITWIPPFWFGLLEIILVTGGASYYFRRIKQPTFSAATWALLIFLMWVILHLASWFGGGGINPAPNAGEFWNWTYVGFAGVFGVWFALTGGFNFSVMSLIHCWPFSLIRQPWGTPVAIIIYFPILYALALATVEVVKFIHGVAGDAAIWQAQILAWQTVAWGWAWVYSFGACSDPYLWAGQKTPGTWEDVA